MAKLSLFFVVICLVGALEQCSGLNYYWQTYPQTQDVLGYPQIAPVAGIWQPDCDKGEGSSSESSSSESSSESKESKEEGGSKSEESKSSSEEEASSSEEEKKESKEEKEGSKEEKEGSKEEKEGSEEGSGEKKEKKKKSKEYKFPPPTYTFPPRPYQQVIYSAPSSYSYLPFRSSYVLQQPVASSYPMKSYQYVSVPTSATVVNGYSSPYIGKMLANPLSTKVVYSAPTISYPATSKVVVPGSRVYALPAAWSGALNYIKK